MRQELRETIARDAQRMMQSGERRSWKRAVEAAFARTRCNATTRKGKPCQAEGSGKGGRCRFHGGMSTGPKSPEGKARSLAAAREGYRRWRARQAEGSEATA